MVGKLDPSKLNAIKMPMPGGQPAAQTGDAKPAATGKSKPGKLNMNMVAALNLPFGGPRGGPQPGGVGAEKGRPMPGKPKSMIKLTDDTPTDYRSQAQAKMSDKAKGTTIAPTLLESFRADWNYLYDLASQFDKFKLQEAEAIKNKQNAPPSEAKQKQMALKKDGANKGVKGKLEGIFGAAGTNFTANGNFLTKEYFDKYLVEEPKFSSLTLNFSNEGALFKRFNRKDQEQRNICQKFVETLLKHPRAPEITQLVMSSSLIPDAFLVALSDLSIAAATHCRESGGGLPKLQVLNLESNVLGNEGIVALSKSIGDLRVWPKLQVLKLENQKQGLSATAEEALGEAVVESPSLVIVGLRVKNGVPKQQIDNTVKMNIDNLRRARRKHKAKAGTLKERKRNEMEQYFDNIAANDSSITQVDLTGNLKFLGLNKVERTKSGAAFVSNKSVKTVKMQKLKLDDEWAKVFGEALAVNSTIETVVLDSNSFSGEGVKTLIAGLGKNKSIVNFQIRHQSKNMASADEEALPTLLEGNNTVTKLGIDTRNQLIKMKLDRKLNETREYQRKQRVAAKKAKG